MALEQWEIDLRNQLAGIPKNLNNEVKNETVKKEPLDFSFYASFIIFLFLSLFLILDFQTDFLSKILHTAPQQQQKEDPQPEKPKEDTTGADVEVIEGVRKLEEKLFLLGIATNENAFILKNGLGKKDILVITKDWKLSKQPKYIRMSDKDKEYLDAIQKNH